ncbi:MAG: IS1634 family transposase, partial [Proteobacteria bacterium]|nr:IS1634 family transposase [Pseudomonadota bacterium]
MDLAKLHLHWRVSRHKGKEYRSYSLARAFRTDGRNRKEIVLKLGKLSVEAADRWRILLKTLKKTDVFPTTCDDIVVTNHFAYLDVAVANAVWNYWKLDDVFQENGKRDIEIANIARILTVNRCIDPVSKSQTPNWFRSTALPWMLDIDVEAVNPSRIFRELEAIENHKEKICRYLFQTMTRNNPKSMQSVFYDLSSTTFSGTCCTIMKWGHCREGFGNHIVLAIVANGDGLPFYWEILPGGTADATTIGWLLERLKKRFKINDTTLVFDRGMVSDDNLALLEGEKIKYISAMDKNQMEKKSDLDFTSFLHLDSRYIDEQAEELEGFTALDNDTYYREAKVENKRRYILCFNPQLFKDQRKSRLQALTDLYSFVDNLNAELLQAKKSRQRKPTNRKFNRGLSRYKLTGFVDIDLKVTHVKNEKDDGTEQKIRTYQGTVHVDEEEMRSVGKLDGFWLLVTNHSKKKESLFELPAEQAISPYREKAVIESAFRDIKSFVEVAPIFVWTKTHIKAHYTVCVLSYLINRTLTLRLHEFKGFGTSEVVSHERLYKEL